MFCGSGSAFSKLPLDAVDGGAVLIGPPRADISVMAAQIIRLGDVLSGEHLTATREKVVTLGGCKMGLVGYGGRLCEGPGVEHFENHFLFRRSPLSPAHP